MKRLILLRHAKAVARGTGSDHDRELASAGRAAAAWAGETIAAAGWVPEAALVSDARRTRETFDIAAPALMPPPALLIRPTLYEAEPDQVLAAVAASPPTVPCVIVVGHNPSLSLVAVTLARAGDAAARHRLRQGMPTAAMAVVDLDLSDWTEVGTAAGTLVAFVTPP